MGGVRAGWSYRFYSSVHKTRVLIPRELLIFPGQLLIRSFEDGKNDHRPRDPPLPVFYDRAAAPIVHFPSPSYHPSDSSTSVISPLFPWSTTGRRKWNFLCDIAQKLIRLTCSLCPGNSRGERRLARPKTRTVGLELRGRKSVRPLDTPSVFRAWRRHREHG